MGCDIHPAVEVRRKGVWRYHRSKEPCRWYDPVNYKWDRCKTALPDYFTDRNYTLFSILADVRNDGLITPIDTPRGTPSDISVEAYRKLSLEHSQTWLSLQDLLDYDIFEPFYYEGVLSAAEYEKLKAGEFPVAWSGGIWGQGIITVSDAAYDALKATGTFETGKKYHVKTRWPGYLPAACPALLQITDYMLALVPKGGTNEDVRMVMDFDS